MTSSPLRARASALVTALATAALLATFGGCDGCGGDSSEGDAPGQTSVDTAQPPSTPRAVSDAFAARLPADAPLLVVVRDPTRLLARYAEVRPRLEAVLGNVGMVETDLRNTLGVDLARPESLSDIGVSASGGFAVAAINDELVVMAILSDADAFVEHATTVLQGQPWNLRADVVEREVGRMTAWEFRRDGDESPRFAVVVDGWYGFLMPAPYDIDATIAQLQLGADQATLASTDAWQAGADVFSEDLLLGYIGVRSSLEDEAVRMRAQLDDGTALQPDELRRRLRTFERLEGLNAATLGADLTSERGRLSVLVHADEALDAQFRAMMTPSSGNPNFARLLGDDTYAVLRASLDPYAVREFARTFFGEEAEAMIEQRLPELQELAGMDLDRFMSAFGGNLMIGATRARLLTLRRVLNDGASAAPGEVATAFGTVVAVQLADADVARDGLRRAAEVMEERAEVFDDGDALVLQFTDEQVDIGNVVVVDDFLFVVPERNRGDVLAQLRSGGGDLSTIGAVEAQNIVTADATNGAWLNVSAVLEGPIGMVIGPALPESVASGLANFDQVFVRGSATEGGIRTDISVVFAPLDDAQ